MNPKRFTGCILVCLTVLVLASCSTLQEWLHRTPPPRNTAEALYQKGAEDFKRGKYKKAIEYFQRVKEEYPLSELAIMAEIGIADAYFTDKEYIDAALNYNEFVNLHPLNENVSYALYQVGMCHYRQIDTIDRDQTETLNAKRSFERLITRFPQSKFVPLAQDMIKQCNKKLAEHELYVGRVYLKMKKYEAALHRFEAIPREFAGLGLDKTADELIKDAQKHIGNKNKN